MATTKIAVRGLSGDFGTMPVKDLIVYLGNKRVSGMLHLERAGVRKEVIIREGKVINSSSNQPREYLGQFLINMGHLTEEQFVKAFETQKETRIFLGRILTMIGLVPEETIRSVLSLKFREGLLEAFHWNEGLFEFDPLSVGQQLEGMDVEVDLLDIHREGEFRETAWQSIRAVFPSGNLRLIVDETRLPEKPKRGSLDERLVEQITDGQTIDDMILALHATDFFLYQRLYALYRLEAVRVSDEVPIEVEIEEPLDDSIVGETPTTAELSRHARNFVEAGNFRDAEALARRVFEISPTADHAELLRKAEAGYAQQLKTKFLNTPRVPALLISPSKLRSIELSAPERYLLSRVDGRRELNGIIQVSPLQQLEALRLFQRFVESGLVSLGE